MPTACGHLKQHDGGGQVGCARQVHTAHAIAAVDSHFSRNAYTMLTVTPLVMAVLVVAVLLMSSWTLVAMGCAAAYLFITAVYYTVKLM